MAQWRWIARFLLACNGGTARRSTAALLQLAFFSRASLGALQRELALDFDWREAGKLVMLPSAAAVEGARRQVDFQRTLGCEQRVLPLVDCVGIEPALAGCDGGWAGGVYTASEQVGDCAAFCAQLAAALARRGVVFNFNTDVNGAVVEKGALVALRSNIGDIAADRFVLANGTGAARLAAQMGLRLPVYPLKGYSVTFAAAIETGAMQGGGVQTGALPSVSITDLAKKIVYARIGARLRVAGRIEIVGHDAKLEARRWRALAQEARRLFPALAACDDELQPWAGMRPSTPDGLPIIGRAPLDKLFINAGHGALGWTLACGSAELLAAGIDAEAAPIARAPFRYRA